MPAMSLQEEFSTYRSDLKELETRVTNASSANTDPGLNRSLTEIGETLKALDTFKPETESSPAIFVMADRATTLIERVKLQCDHIGAI